MSLERFKMSTLADKHAREKAEIKAAKPKVEKPKKVKTKRKK